MEDKKSNKQLIIKILCLLFGLGAIVVFLIIEIVFNRVGEDGQGMVDRVKGILLVALIALMPLIWWIMGKNPERKTLNNVLFTILSILIIASILYFTFFAFLTAALNPRETVLLWLYLIFAVPWYVLLCVLYKQRLVAV